MTTIPTTALLLGATLALTACGDTRMEHIGSGALMGAGVGVGVAALTADTLLTGGLIGLGVGTVAGAIAPPCAMNNWTSSY